MKSWSLKRTLGWGLGGMLALNFIGMSVTDYLLTQTHKRVDRTANVVGERIDLFHALGVNTGAAWSGEQSALASLLVRDRRASDNNAQEAQTAQAAMNATLSRLRPLLELQANRAALEKTAELTAAWQENAREVFRLAHLGQGERAERLSRAKDAPLYAEVAKLAEEMRARHVHLLDRERETSKADYRIAEWIMAASMMLCMGVGAFLLWVFWRTADALRNQLRELRQGGEQVAAAATQIASSSQSLSQGASDQAASLEQVSASMEQMAAMTKRNAENSSQATAMMLETGSQVERSNRALKDMEASMVDMKASSEKVAKINKTIDEIAFQTNILALNAAVEAARAGSAGMGFAVVAGEVRNLAQRSAVAAKDTAVLIGEAIASSNESVSKLVHVTEAIQAITEGAGKVKNLVDEVNEASKQQAQGIEQVAAAISQVSKVTQTTAASAEQSAAASEELSAQSRIVRQLATSLQFTVDRSDAEGIGGFSSIPGLMEDRGSAGLLSRTDSGSRPRSQGFGRPVGVAAPVPRGRSSRAEKLFPMESSGESGFHNF